MSLLKAGIVLAAVSGTGSAGSINIAIDTSAIAGSHLGVAIDFVTSEPGETFFCSPTCLKIIDFSAPGATMGLPASTGGLVQGDLILLNNPANMTEIEKGSAFNEVIVNLNPVGSSVTFTLEYSDTGPTGGLPPDQVSVFLLGSDNLPLFPTDDPLGTDALFAVDLTGVVGGEVSVFGPAKLTGPGNIAITIPGGGPPVVPEPSTLGMVIAAASLAALQMRRSKFRARRTS